MRRPRHDRLRERGNIEWCVLHNDCAAHRLHEIKMHAQHGARRILRKDRVSSYHRPVLGQPVQIPIVNTGDPNSDQGALIAHAILEPNAPLTRPGTNADWIDAVIGLASAGAMAAHPAPGAEAPIAPEPVPPTTAKPFITLRAKLSADFDKSIPIGKFEARDDLNPVDFGNYAHDEIGALLQKAAGTDVRLELYTAPYTRGVDITVPADFADDVGFEYGEIKPLSRTGRSRFNNQVLNIWNLEGRVQPITYDRKGNIYYGFPGYDEP
jgi:hypothetical protein